MIPSHQPKLFGPVVIAAVSSRVDGDMKFDSNDLALVIKNREGFLSQARILLGESVLIKVSYQKPDFTMYRQVDHEDVGAGMHDNNVEAADALVTAEPGVALFLPLADCVGAILYDPHQHILMVSHLGRHSLEQDGAARSVKYLQETFGCNPAEVLVWLSPSAGKGNYPLHALGDRSMHEVIIEGLEATGVTLSHIESSSVDTTLSEDYFSHSQFLKGNRADDGRFAIVAMMSGRGEPA